MKKILTVIFTGLLSFALFGGEAEDIQKAIALHDIAGKGNVNAVEECKKLLEPYLEKNVIAMGFYGSAITIEAGIVSEKNPFKALDLLGEGSGYIDKAVEKEPENEEIRILRLANGIEVSAESPYKRYSVIRKDVEFFEDEKHMKNLDDETKAYVYLNMGLYKTEEGDFETALEYFEAAAESKPGSKSAKKAEELLALYEE